jgi:sec-independent protein translocase protein TatA
MAPSWLKILVVVLLVVLLFGRGKIATIMGDFARGIKNFKRELKDGDESEDASKAVPRSTKSHAEKRPETKV